MSGEHQDPRKGGFPMSEALTVITVVRLSEGSRRSRELIPIAGGFLLSLVLILAAAEPGPKPMVVAFSE